MSCSELPLFCSQKQVPGGLVLMHTFSVGRLLGQIFFTWAVWKNLYFLCMWNGIFPIHGGKKLKYVGGMGKNTSNPYEVLFSGNSPLKIVCIINW